MTQTSITKEHIQFNDLERTVYAVVCELGCSILQRILREMDLQIRKERNRKEYENKGLRKTHIETLMGRVEVHRRCYKTEDEDGNVRYRYLLDEQLELFQEGKLSGLLAETALHQVLTHSYRETSKTLKRCTRMDLSHMGIWNLVQSMGKRMKKQQQGWTQAYEQGDSPGQRQVEVLFEESDGIYLKLQGKDRKKHGNNRELKVAVTYEGWKKIGADRYKLVHKNACCSYEGVEAFRKLKEGMLASQYNMAAIKLRVHNGDGAEWIHHNEDARIVSQLDPFHLKRALRRGLRSKQMCKTVEQLLEEKKIPLALEVLQTLKDSAQDEKDKQRVQELYAYLTNNHQLLIPYRERGLNLPLLPDGMEYRGMGTMENQNCSMITHRMKGRKGSWSVKGSSNMAMVLCANASYGMKECLKGQWKAGIPDRYKEQIEEGMSAAKALRPIGKGEEGGVHRGGMPFRGAFMTPGRKAIRRMIEADGLWG